MKKMFIFQKLFLFVCMFFMFIVTYWCIGHILNDIGNLSKVNFNPIKEKYVSSKLEKQKRNIQRKIANLNTQISRTKEKERILRQSSSGFQNTVNQVIKLQEKNLKIEQKNSEKLNKEVGKAFTLSLQEFFNRQKTIEKYAEKRINLLGQKNTLKNDLSKINNSISSQKKEAHKEYNALVKDRKNKETLIKLLFLIPFFLFFFIISNTSWVTNYNLNSKLQTIAEKLFVNRKIASIKIFTHKHLFYVYSIITFAFFIHMVKNIAQYTPKTFTVYTISFVLLIVLGFLIVFVLDNIQKKKKTINNKEKANFKKMNYLKNLCPSCGYPLKKDIDPSEQADIYCSNCGAHTHTSCQNCENQRKTFMDYCDFCGDHKDHFKYS